MYKPGFHYDKNNNLRLNSQTLSAQVEVAFISFVIGATILIGLALLVG